ncbi:MULTISPECIES: hypothetical protein [Aneurinibacillus]|uniref:Lipoprotein n=1 Tax=Aneurinibacillus thermoaerophilus TaxID=143495 RepID=A0A1G8DZF1_ANETH|nr:MULTISPECIES: hypothetical protein [Aneurinibacillus]AMA74160.1 hypothetical protein ACH33_15935 [Aneurinibacillus sp. XH2]MED0677255.1 hypothetical protein [Aneurinibacillus thermoaerophilus]MED0677876.1 hypothetical protein [Aneurinibacillus thermoaerophilus]MED0738568.1 hypothetical protein [Aneurinibacillus thermoaerophilus]MED0758385.1 hypothetical protein [Aneurinibacillus thermoaerophilus]
MRILTLMLVISLFLTSCTEVRDKEKEQKKNQIKEEVWLKGKGENWKIENCSARIFGNSIEFEGGKIQYIGSDLFKNEKNLKDFSLEFYLKDNTPLYRHKLIYTDVNILIKNEKIGLIKTDLPENKIYDTKKYFEEMYCLITWNQEGKEKIEKIKLNIVESEKNP